MKQHEFEKNGSKTTETKKKGGKCMIEELKPYIYDILKEILPKGKEVVVNGKREYLCLCPFHTDRNPSFYVNLDKGVYHCFGCGEKGDIIHLYAKMNHLDDKEAIIELKRRFLPENIPNKTKEQKLDNLLKKALYMWNTAQEDLEMIKSYLKARGIGTTPSLSHLKLYKNNIMLAKVVNPLNELKSLHMTILEHKDGKIKAKEKKVLQGLPIKGYAVHFGEPIDSLAVTEGIETALSIKEALPTLPVWACLSAVNMPEILLPEDNTIKNVYIFFDKDKNNVGLKAAEELARKLTKDKDINVYLVEPPIDIKDENAKGVDFNDVLVQKGKEAIIYAFKKAKKFEDVKGGLKSPVDKAISFIKENVELFHTKDDEAYAKIKKDNFTEIRKIRSLSVKRYISSVYYKNTKKALSSHNIQNVIDTLDAMATSEGKEEPVFKRVAFHNNRLYVDLADEKWRVVEISESGWKILDKSPVNFVRFKNTLPLPEPKRSFSSADNPIESDMMKEFRKLFNLEKEEDFYVILSFLLNVLSPFESYIGLALIGEQGTAKTTTARIIKHIIDPDRKTKLSTPKSEEDLIISSKTSKLLLFDNLSKCTQRFSDSLCRLLDGSGISKRRLFTDEDESVLYASSPIILTSITNPFTTYPDLIDRLVILNLKPIDKKNRKTEEEIFKKLNEIHPYVLGGLFDLVSSGLRNITKVDLKEKPRRADFAVWLTACEYDEYIRAEEKLLPAYLSNIDNIVTMSLDNNPLASTLIEWFENKEEWEGTVTELKNQILNFADKERKTEIPKASNKFSERLIRLSSFFRKTGIDIIRKRTNRGSIITITTIEKIEK